MKPQNIHIFRLGFLLCASILVAWGLAGCSTTDNSKAMVVPDAVTNIIVPRLQVGDTVTITFSGLPNLEDLPVQEKPIKEDGTITLPDIGRVQAAGKTAGELEDYIHSLYVPAFYTHLGVTVKTSSDLVYFVRGEVKNPGRELYTGSLTVTKAITSAGDFTDFANRKKVILTRFNGERYRLNADRILNGEAPDPPVFPGDQIEVKRRLW
jgi:polysaccharide export outer membrane protein